MAGQLSQHDVTQILLTALAEFRAVLGLDVPAQRIQTLLEVAATPDLEQADLARALGGMGEATVSRQLAELSAITRKGEKGPNLIRQEVHPAYRRRNVVKLTAEGEGLMRAVAEKVNKKLAKTKH